MFLRINGFTHRYGPPEGWDEDTQGICNTVYVREEMHGNMKMNYIAIEFTPEEMASLVAGEPLILGVCGEQMPACFVRIGDCDHD